MNTKHLSYISAIAEYGNLSRRRAQAEDLTAGAEPLSGENRAGARPSSVLPPKPALRSHPGGSHLPGRRPQNPGHPVGNHPHLQPYDRIQAPPPEHRHDAPSRRPGYGLSVPAADPPVPESGSEHPGSLLLRTAGGTVKRRNLPLPQFLHARTDAQRPGAGFRHLQPLASLRRFRPPPLHGKVRKHRFSSPGRNDERAVSVHHGHPFALYGPHTFSGQLIDQVFKRAGFSPVAVFHSDNVATISSMLASGLYAGFVLNMTPGKYRTWSTFASPSCRPTIWQLGSFQKTIRPQKSNDTRPIFTISF